jgi:hypothetical protein
LFIVFEDVKNGKAPLSFPKDAFLLDLGRKSNN